MPDPDIRNKLLPFTLDNASQISFYERLWAKSDYAVVGDVRDLPKLPCLTKQMYRESYMTHFDWTSSHFVSHSTGTTGELTYRHRSLLEASVIDHFFSAGRAEPAELKLGIELTNAYHGMPMPFPGSGISIPAGTHTDAELHQCVNMLQATFHLHGQAVRSTFLGGASVDVAIVAQALYAAGQDPSALPLQTVTVTGPVDEGLRRFITRAFGTPLYERFSMSEIFGGGTRDPGEQCFVTDPYVIAEVTNDDGWPVGDGEAGWLTMTELYPFVQLQPLIRYVSGDIVRRVSEPAPGQLAFQWLGRAGQCIRLADENGRPVTLGFRPLADALGLLPCVARQRLRPQLAALVGFGDLGLPKIGISAAGGRSVRIRVGVLADPRFHPDEAQTVVDRLWETLGVMADGVTGIDASITLALDRSQQAHDDDGLSGALRLPPFPLAGPAPFVIKHVFRPPSDAMT
jgi:hypothetical protein